MVNPVSRKSLDFTPSLRAEGENDQPTSRMPRPGPFIPEGGGAAAALSQQEGAHLGGRAGRQWELTDEMDESGPFAAAPPASRGAGVGELKRTASVAFEEVPSLTLQDRKELAAKVLKLAGLGDTLGYWNGDIEFTRDTKEIWTQYRETILQNLRGQIVSDDTVFLVLTHLAMLECEIAGTMDPESFENASVLAYLDYRNPSIDPNHGSRGHGMTMGLSLKTVLPGLIIQHALKHFTVEEISQYLKEKIGEELPQTFKNEMNIKEIFEAMEDREMRANVKIPSAIARFLLERGVGLGIEKVPYNDLGKGSGQGCGVGMRMAILACAHPSLLNDRMKFLEALVRNARLTHSSPIGIAGIACAIFAKEALRDQPLWSWILTANDDLRGPVRELCNRFVSQENRLFRSEEDYSLNIETKSVEERHNFEHLAIADLFQKYLSTDLEPLVNTEKARKAKDLKFLEAWDTRRVAFSLVSQFSPNNQTEYEEAMGSVTKDNSWSAEKGVDIGLMAMDTLFYAFGRLAQAVQENYDPKTTKPSEIKEWLRSNPNLRGKVTEWIMEKGALQYGDSDSVASVAFGLLGIVAGEYASTSDLVEHVEVLPCQEEFLATVRCRFADNTYQRVINKTGPDGFHIRRSISNSLHTLDPSSSKPKVFFDQGNLIIGFDNYETAQRLVTQITEQFGIEFTRVGAGAIFSIPLYSEDNDFGKLMNAMGFEFDEIIDLPKRLPASFEQHLSSSRFRQPDQLNPKAEAFREKLRPAEGGGGAPQSRIRRIWNRLTRS